MIKFKYSLGLESNKDTYEDMGSKEDNGKDKGQGSNLSI